MPIVVTIAAVELFYVLILVGWLVRALRSSKP